MNDQNLRRCARCHRAKVIVARGLCGSCQSIASRNGTIQAFPRAGIRIRAQPQVFRPAPWMARALCATKPRDLCFPDTLTGLDAAKAVCARCPVQGACLEYGLDEPFGVWGGLDPRERRKLRQAMATKKAA